MMDAVASAVAGAALGSVCGIISSLAVHFLFRTSPRNGAEGSDDLPTVSDRASSDPCVRVHHELEG